MEFKEGLLYDTPTEKEFMQIIKWKEKSDCDFQNFDKTTTIAPTLVTLLIKRNIKNTVTEKMIDKSTSFTTPPSNTPPEKE